MAAFKHGHWRAAISDIDTRFGTPSRVGEKIPTYGAATAKGLPYNGKYSFAFQPILNAKTKQVFSYEALLRGRKNESARQILNSVNPSEVCRLDDQSRIFAINLAAHLGLSTHLNLNIAPSTVISSPSSISSTLEIAEKFQILPEQIVLEILESEIIEDFKRFADAIRGYRGSGLLLALDDSRLPFRKARI